MGTSDEVDSPTTDATPLPIAVGGLALPRAAHTPAAVLSLIAAAAGQPWFPSRYALAKGIDRDDLDDPLTQLRLSGLVRVATWVRGAGQGYVLTAEGEAAALVAGTAAGNAPREAGPTPKDTPAGADLDDRSANRYGLDPRPPVLIPLLLIANVFWFGAGVVAVLRGGYSLGRYLSDGHPYLLHRLGAVHGLDLLEGGWYRLLSSCFVHIGLLHLLANVFALAMMGPLAELLWGRWRLAAIYLVAGLAGSSLAMTLRPDSTLAGASGAIWGVLASLLAWLMLFRSQLPADVASDWARRLWVVFVLNAGVSLLPGVSWEAHLAGGVAGFLAAWLLNVVRYGTRLRRRVAVGCLVAIPVVSVAGLRVAMDRAEGWVELRQKIADLEAEHARRAVATEQKARDDAAVVAWQAFHRDVGPRVGRLAPDQVKPAQTDAGILLLSAAERRSPRALAAVRARLIELKATADETVGYLSAPPAGSEPLEAHRRRAKEFAEARSKSFGLLLAMLDTPTVPDDAAWAAWSTARRTADGLWELVPAR